MSAEKRRNKKIRLIFALICSTILFYQSFYLIMNYMKFETTIMIETNDGKQIIEFPAISICERLPRIEIVTRDKTILTRLPFSLTILYIEKKWAQVEDGIIKMNVNKVIEDFGLMEKRNGTDKIKNQFLSFSNESVKCIDTFCDTKQDKYCYPSFYSINSIAQCRTFFGQFNTSGHVVSRTVKRISSTLEDSNDVLAYFAINFTDLNRNKQLFPDKEVFIMVHGSNEAPSHRTAPFASRRFLLKVNSSYDLSFFAKKYIRLPEPYNTDCNDYKPNVNSTNIYDISRELCLSKCRNDAVLKKFGCLVVNMNFIYGQIYENNHICDSTILLNMTDEGIHGFDWKAQVNCYRICKPECDRETYVAEMHEVEGEFKSAFNLTDDGSDMGYVAVLTNHMAQLTYHHLPKMALLDFLCNVGGLFSLWLGLSVISVYDYSVAIGSAFSSRLKHRIK